MAANRFERQQHRAESFEMIKERYPAFVELLSERHRAIVARSGELARQNSSPENSLSNAELNELRDIMAAAHRIRNGLYGLCEECGETIALGRLQAMPYSRFCVQCQSMRERQSA